MIKLTAKQLDILTTIKKGNSDGSLCTVYDLMDKLSYEVKRDALLHSIKILVEEGYVERRAMITTTGKSRPQRVFSITTKALEIV